MNILKFLPNSRSGRRMTKIDHPNHFKQIRHQNEDVCTLPDVVDVNARYNHGKNLYDIQWVVFNKRP